MRCELSRIGAMVLGVSLAFQAGIAVAQDTVEPRPWPKFESKRLKPPSGNAGSLINIQIRPGAKRITPPKPQDKTPVVPDAPVFAWFWSKVPHDLVGAGPERFTRALEALTADGAETVPAPRLQTLSDIARAHGADILLNSIGTKVSPALALAIIAVESTGRTTVESHAGAKGLMQLMPDTAARFGVDPADPAQNIKGGITYLDWLLNEFDGDPVLALAGYNAGENAVKAAGGVPDYKETRAYIPKVMAAWQVAKGLCLTPPDLYFDGCVFASAGAVPHE